MTRASETIVIDKRFCGLKASANGGYAAGIFAREVDGPAEVTLKSPPRFEPMVFERADDGFAAVCDGIEISRMKPGEQLTVAAWKTGEEGRKRFSSSAIYDASKKITAAANAVWIEIADQKLIERLRSDNS